MSENQGIRISRELIEEAAADSAVSQAVETVTERIRNRAEKLYASNKRRTRPWSSVYKRRGSGASGFSRPSGGVFSNDVAAEFGTNEQKALRILGNAAEQER